MDASFETRLRERLKGRLSEPELGLLEPFREAARVLSDDDVDVKVVQKPDEPRRWYFTMGPRYRPAEAIMMLSMWVESEAINISGKETVRLPSRGLVENWLESFVLTEAFLDARRQAQESAREAVDAVLRRVDARTGSAGDTEVVVPPEEQRKLVEAHVGEPVEMVVVLNQLQHWGGGVTQESKFAALVSAGPLLKDVTAWPRGANGELLLRGTRTAA